MTLALPWGFFYWKTSRAMIRPKMPQASHRMILIKFLDWMRGIFTMEPRMEEEVIMIPLLTHKHKSMLACFLMIDISMLLTFSCSDMSTVMQMIWL